MSLTISDSLVGMTRTLTSMRTCSKFLGIMYSMGVRQRSGEGVVRRNGRPKGCFGESVSSLPC